MLISLFNGLANYKLSNFLIGTHNLTISVTLTSGKTKTDSIWLFVKDTISPQVLGSDDIFCAEEKMQFIIWNITDKSEGNYVIYKNESRIASGVWSKNSSVSIEVKSWIPNQFLFWSPSKNVSYNFKLEVFDSTGNMGHAVVLIIVLVAGVEDFAFQLPPYSATFPNEMVDDTLFIILIVIGSIAVIIIAKLLIRLHKKAIRLSR